VTATIWKFPFKLADAVVLSMPRGAQLLHVGPSNEPGKGDLCVWARVVPGNPRVTRHLRVYGTRHTLAPSSGADRYIGTVELGIFVWHVYDDGETA
jgi:hypothetical protein